MSSQFRDTDAELLLQVVQLANQRFLRQSRVHQKSSFNILRMLSAYKEISEGFPSRKQQIYNWIIYITKNYNPQTMKQWQNAIKDLSQGCRKSMSHGQTRANILHNGANVNMNKTTNQFYNQIDQENVQINQCDFHNRSQYLPQKISQQLKNIHRYSEYFSRDNSQTNIMAPISSKIQHYISFEPEQNKQNINSANTNSEHLKSEQLRFDNHPTRTPGERSFIHNLPMSYGSPFVMSKITNNTKDVTQIQQQEQLTPLQANMKTRADLFHDINLKFKAFSALLASFQALQIFQLLIKKTKQFQKSMYFFRFIESATQYRITKNKKQEYYRTAYQFYELSLTKKSFKVLNVLSKLKIQKKDKKKIQLNKFNRINIEFLTSLIFNPLSEERQFGQYTDTPKSIRQKSKYFQNIEDCQKMQMISEFFSNNLRMSKEQIKNLFDILHRIRKQQTFNILKSNVRKFTNENQLVILMRRRQSLKDFINVSAKIFCSTARIKLMKINSDRKIKQKSFRALFQFSISKKIYYKREEFLSQKHRQKIMKQIIQKWKGRNQTIRIRKLGFQSCVKKGLTLIESILLKKHFQTIKEISLQIKERILESQRQENKQICKDVFNFLKKRMSEKKVYLKIKEKFNRNLKNKTLQVWAKFMRTCLLVKQIKKIFSKNAFDFIKKEYQQNYNSSLLSDHLIKMSYYLGVKQFRISYNLDKKQCEANIKKIEREIRKNFLLRFIQNCRLQLRLKKNQLQRNERGKKISILKQTLEKNSKKKSLHSFVLKSKDHLSYFKKIVIISSVMGNRVIQQLGPQNLRKTYTRCHQNLKRDAINELKQNLDMKKMQIILSNTLKTSLKRFISERINTWRAYTRNKNKIQFFRGKQNSSLKRSVWGYFKKQYENYKVKVQKGVKRYNKYLKFTTLLSFAKNLIDIQTKIKQTSKNRSINQKLQMGRKVLLFLKQNMQFISKQKKANKLTSLKYISSSLRKTISLKKKRQTLNELRKKNYIQKLVLFKKQVKKIRYAEVLEDKKYKRFAVMKVNRAVFRHILRKKEICMAIKFKAIQLCKISFKALLGNRNIGMSSTLGHSKKFHLHQHISTSYTSL